MSRAHPVDYSIIHGEVGAYCPECGHTITFGVGDPEDVERHPATPEDEPVTAYCEECNAAFGVRVP